MLWMDKLPRFVYFKHPRFLRVEKDRAGFGAQGAQVERCESQAVRGGGGGTFIVAVEADGRHRGRRRGADHAR